MIIDINIQVENFNEKGHLSHEGARHPKLFTVLQGGHGGQKAEHHGELIIALTFIPILSLEGIEGRCSDHWRSPSPIALLGLAVPSVFVIPALCICF